MRRIGLAVIVAVGLFLVPLSGGAQLTGKLFRIGLLSPASLSDANGKPSDLAIDGDVASGDEPLQMAARELGRQRDELRDRQKAAPQQADAIGVQIRSLESRMSGDRSTA